MRTDLDEAWLNATVDRIDRGDAAKTESLQP